METTTTTTAKKKSKLDPKIIRRGDVVEIVNPQAFLRCGYPLSLEDGKEYIEKNMNKDVLGLLNKVAGKENRFNNSTYHKIVKLLAYEYIKSENFGGNERRIFTKEYKDMKGKEALVESIKFVKTGIYNRGYVGYNYSGDYECDPPYLSYEKTHKILTLSITRPRKDSELNWYEPIMIEAIHVKKLMSEEERMEQYGCAYGDWFTTM